MYTISFFKEYLHIKKSSRRAYTKMPTFTLLNRYLLFYHMVGPGLFTEGTVVSEKDPSPAVREHISQWLHL